MSKKIKICRVFILPGLVFLLVIMSAGCGDSGHIFESDAVIVGADGEPIDLVNNPSASNPTYALLEAFVKTDTTDNNIYTDYYSCGDFAEDVHNNAEAIGIRAGWVGIFFIGEENGHACNVFQTTDRGLVYIDCTGSNPKEMSVTTPPHNSALKKATSWDKVAYLELGREYGLIAINRADSLLYSYYDDYQQSWQKYEELVDEYNDEVTQYNDEIEGKVYQQGSAELARIEAWEKEIEEMKADLDRMAQELGDFRFEPLGIVEDIDIHW
ncbi:hypothetical protein ACFLUH_01905 [Chloroflexota bacterium]